MTKFYLGVVSRADDNSWDISVPDLPGCTASGRSMDEVSANANEAVRRRAEEATDCGGLPEPRAYSDLTRDRAVRAALKRAGDAGFILRIPLRLSG